jgi:hypothetical protein
MAANTVVAMIIRSKLKSSGETSRSASLTTTKVEPQMAAVRINSREALRVCFAMVVLLRLSRAFSLMLCGSGEHLGVAFP